MKAAQEIATFGMLGETGQLVLYHQGEVNLCPTCGQSQWYIGRKVAECVRCNAAFPLVSPVSIEFSHPEKEAA